MSNERLRGQLLLKGMTVTELASRIQVDPKTIDRWIKLDRLPHPRHRMATSAALHADEAYLWPRLLGDASTQRASRGEIVDVYPTRGVVPPEVWRRMIEESTEHVDVLVFAGLFLVDSNPDLPQRLADAAEDGLQARLAFGDPESEVTARRGEEEGIGDDLGARVRLALRYIEPAVGHDGIEVRQHRTVLYNSIYRFDDQMLVNTHVIGSPAGSNPVLHIQRVPGGCLFDHYLRSFELVWSSATPLGSDQAA